MLVVGKNAVVVDVLEVERVDSGINRTDVLTFLYEGRFVCGETAQ